MKTGKKKRGRPPTDKSGPLGGRLSRTRTFRVRGGMDEHLREVAEASGRSISEEIEARLERSFFLDDVLSVVAGEKATLIQALSAAVQVSGAWSGGMGERAIFPVLKAASAIIIDHFAGRTIPRTADEDLEDLRAEVGGTISGPDVAYQLTARNVARQVFWGLGLIKPTRVSMATASATATASTTAPTLNFFYDDLKFPKREEDETK